ncbi:MAG: dienelactone hydrolase family protein [Thermomicrobiales bacterium]
MAASDIRTEDVSFASNGDTAHGYLARPAGDGLFPALVVIQEWWGLDAHIKDLAERFAGEGFVALAPDFYHGQVVTEPDDARKLVMALNGPIALREIGGALGYLGDLPEVEPKSVGVIGFCAGGRLALAAAATGDERIGAVAAFYGGGVQPTPEFVGGIKAPVLAVYGEDDAGIPPEQYNGLEAEMDRQEKTFAMVVYPGAGHAFLNDTRPGYNASAAADAWTRAVQWFHTYLA